MSSGLPSDLYFTSPELELDANRKTLPRPAQLDPFREQQKLIKAKPKLDD
jgi:hypothetical protein